MRWPPDAARNGAARAMAMWLKERDVHTGDACLPACGASDWIDEGSSCY